MKVVKTVGIVLVLLALGAYIFAKINHVTPLGMVDKAAYNTYSGIAIKEYDAVSYFVESPKKGLEDFQTEYGGALWYFDSQENLDLFKANPQKFAPQFGGYCSFAVTTGFTATINPEAYTIQNGKLYLFNAQDVKINFLMSADNSIETAESKWVK